MVSLLTAALFAALPGVADDSGLRPPVPLKSGGKVIDVDTGHAAPFVAKIDGKNYLLVGQFSGGKLRMYPLSQAESGYKIGKFSWFQAGNADGRVPAG